MTCSSWLLLGSLGHAGPDHRAGVAGPPVFLSNAHFCDVDPAVADTVIGLNCSQKQHVTFLDVEPVSGITMRAAKRLMMSTEYGPGQLQMSRCYLVLCKCMTAFDTLRCEDRL